MLWVLGFGLLVWAGDRLGGRLLDSLTMSSQFRYSRLYTGRAACDLLLVGNSRGLAFYQPYIEEKTGLKTLNLSYNGLPVDLAGALVRDYYDRYAPPRSVLIDISLSDRFDEQLLVHFSPYLPYSARIDTLIRQANARVRAGLSLSHLYRYNSEVFHRALFYLNRSDEAWHMDRELTAGQAQGIAPDYEFVIKYPEQAPQLLAQLVQFCQDRGSEVHLILGPYYPPFARHITNLEAFRQSVELATGLPVNDLSQTISDHRLFADYQHLNKAGSEVFIDQLISLGLID